MHRPLKNSTFRTGSLNSFPDFSKEQVQGTRRASSSQSLKRRNTQMRPVTPAIQRASDDHIHRIRSVTSRAKEKLQLIVPPPPPSCKASGAHDSSDSETDVESVHWTAPLDITSILYKTEYVIRPASGIKRLVGSARIAGTKDTDTTTETPRTSLPLVPLESPRQMKDAMMKNYMAGGKSPKLFPYKEITDYNLFIRKVTDDLRVTSSETIRLETSLPCSKAWKRDKRGLGCHNGYLALKQMYELNPALTENAAKRYICGPPGNPWLGLSRVDVLEVLRRIRKELNIPTDLHPDDEPQMNYNRYEIHRKCTKKKRKNKKKPKHSLLPKEPKVKTPRSRKLTPLLLQHVPGPKHLHTNICIRPWEPDLDGWHSDTNENRQKPRSDSEGISEIPVNLSSLNVSPQVVNSIQRKTPNVANDTVSDEFITLEVLGI